MRVVIRSNKFKKAYKQCEKRNYKMKKLDELIFALMQKEDLPRRYRVHKLVGNYHGQWECHIEPDWLLTYPSIRKH